MKKNLTKKLMLSVLTLAFAVVSLGASTFAWFTLSGTVTVDPFKADVTGGNGIDVAITPLGVEATADDDTYTWYTGNLPGTAIEEIIGTNVKFDAVTTTDFSKSVVTDPAELTKFTGIDTSMVKTKNIAYIGFNLNFKVTDYLSVDEKVTLKLENLVLTGTNAKEWYADIAFDTDNTEDVVLGDPYTYSVVSAARVAIVNEAGNETVYEQAKGNGADVESNTLGFQPKGALDYYNKKQGKSVGVGTQSYATCTQLGAGNALVDKLDITEFTELTDKTDLTTGTADDVYTISVYVWLEGWDGECFNAIFNQNLQVALQFGIYDKTGAKIN